MKKLFLLIWVVLVWPAFTCPQTIREYPYSYLSVNDGLSQQDIETAIQDRYGFLWFASYDGLNRYDGYEFKVFRHDPDDRNSIPDNRITALCESDDGTIWIGTENSGLICYRPSSESFAALNGDIPTSGNNSKINVICEFKKGKLLVGSNSGLFVVGFSDYGNITMRRVFPGPEGGQSIRSILLDNRQFVWVGTGSGYRVLRFDDQERITVIRSGLKNSAVNHITQDREGRIWLGHTGGLSYVEAGKFAVQAIPSFAENVKCMVEFNPGQYILSSLHDLFYLDFAKQQVLNFSEYCQSFFSANLIKNLFLDQSHNLWVLSGNKGLMKIDMTPVKFYKLNFGVEDIFIKSFIQTSDGRYVIGSKDFGLFLQKEKESGKYLRLFRNRTVASICEDQDRNIWVCCNPDIYMIPPENRNEPKALDIIKGFSPGNMGSPLSITPDYDGSVWIGFGKGLLKVSGRAPEFKFRFYPFVPVPQAGDNLVMQLYRDETDSCLWACTKDAGLYRLSLKRGKGEGDMSHKGQGKDALNSNHVWSIDRSDDSTLWVGTDTGLNKLTGGKGQYTIRPVQSDKSVRTGKIMAITCDHNRTLWMNTSQGLLAYDIEGNVVKEYFHSDGLYSNTLSEASFKDTRGNIFVGSIAGVNRFSPERFQPNPYLPKVALTKLSIHNKPVEINKKVRNQVVLTRSLQESRKIVLTHRNNNCRFEVAPLHFSNPSKNKIAYKLEGFDTDWVVASDRVISYSNLPTGTYALHVRASNSDGAWNNEELALGLVIRPSPWLTPWAMACYFAVVSLIFLVILKYYQQQRKFRFQLRIEQIEHEKDMQLNEAKLQFHTNITHELRTPLSLIAGPLHELNNRDFQDKDNFICSRLELITKNTNVLLRLTNQFLDFRKTLNSHIVLDITRQSLAQCIRKVSEIFLGYAEKNNINFQFINEFEGDEVWFDEEKVVKVVMNLLSNAFKFTANGGSVFIFLHPDRDRAVITVEDTGSGIPEKVLPFIFNRYFSKGEKLGGTGIGLALTKQLVEAHQGTIVAESDVSKGTRFRVTIPVNKEAYSGDVVQESTVPEKKPGGGEFPLLQENKREEIMTGEKPTVLLVEDNPDLSDYISEILSAHYRVARAYGGNEGMKLAISNIPDIVITDVMMEGMDGFALVRGMKEDVRTSHIPVIILTALSSHEATLEGLKTGAADYLTKPFNPEILQIKIANLIRLSQNRTNGNNDPGDREDALSETEKRFIGKLRELILSEMANPDFSIEFVCKQLGTSRMQLHRKMKSITGKNASEFIRDVRFAHARVLLETTGSNLSETMFGIGLSDLYAFTQTFLKIFGIHPSDIIKKRKQRTEQLQKGQEL